MEFNYYGADFIQFETDFNKLYTGDEPLTFITDDLLKAMTVDMPYFVLPPQQAKDGRKHIFYFEAVGDKYEYSHCI